MYAMDALKLIAIETKKTYADISKGIGKNRTYVNGIARRKSEPQTNTLASMLSVCGYALCAVPKDKVTDDMYVIGD